MSVTKKMIAMLEAIRDKYKVRRKTFNYDDEDGEWVTIKGTHVLIDDYTGAIIKGPERLRALNNTERGKSSTARRIIEKSKNALKQYVDKLTEAKKKALLWEGEKSRASYSRDYYKQQADAVNEDYEKRKKRVEDLYPEGKDNVQSKIDEYDERLEELNKILYPENRENRLEYHEREKAFAEYNKLLEERGKLYDAMADFRGLERAKNSAERWNKKVEEENKKYDDILSKDPTKEYEDVTKEYDRLAKKRNEAVLRIFKTASDCQTTEDVNDYLIAKGYFDSGDGQFSADQKVKLDGMKAEFAVKNAETLDRIMEDYPGLKGKLGGVDCRDINAEPGHKNTWAYANGTTVSFASKHYGEDGDIAEAYEKSEKSHFHPHGTDYTSIVDHEYAHAIENIIQKKLGMKQKPSDVIMKRVMKRVDGKYLKDDEDGLRLKVSQYSARNKGIDVNPKTGKLKEWKLYGRNTEFLAEALAEARNSKNPSPYAVAAREELEKIMKEANLI